jgi:hypothetical protein
MNMQQNKLDQQQLRLANAVEKWWTSLEPEQRKSHKRAIERHFERPILARTEGKGERE